MGAWMKSDRFKHTTRPFTAEQVVKLQGTMPLNFVGSKLSDKLYKMMREHQANGTCSHTFGALDPVQVVQMAKYLTTVYVSGWQSSSTASTSNEPGPDVADYPYDTAKQGRPALQSPALPRSEAIREPQKDVTRGACQDPYCQLFQPHHRGR